MPFDDYDLMIAKDLLLYINEGRDALNKDQFDRLATIGLLPSEYNDRGDPEPLSVVSYTINRIYRYVEKILKECQKFHAPTIQRAYRRRYYAPGFPGYQRSQQHFESIQP